MEIIPQPGFNVDKLEGAVSHMLQICGCLSDDAINSFAQHYAFQRGKKLQADYASTKLIPRMRKERKAFQTGSHYFSPNPVVRHNKKTQDAFWVFLENMEDVDTNNVMRGPVPAQISYIKKGAIYHIICVDKEGPTEMGLATQLEIETMQRRRRHPSYTVAEERYIFVFSAHEYAERAPFVLKSPCLFGVVEYAPGAFTPTLDFFKPDQPQDLSLHE